MESLQFASPSWCNALTLTERAALLSGIPASISQAERQTARGQRRLERWRSQWPFDTEPYLEQRLARDGMDEGRFLEILSTTAQELRQGLAHDPKWLAQLAEAYSRPATAMVDYPPGEEMLGFLDLLQPLIDQACFRLRAGIAELAGKGPDLPFDPETIEDILLMNLPEPLLMRLSRTLTLELNVARLQGLLEGETPADRFRSFVQGLRDPERATEVLAEYPVLARQLHVTLERWADVSLEFLGRLCADWAAIRHTFSPADYPGPLAELRGGAGDTHRGGRSVMVAEFDSGFRIVYKPKPLAIDVHFQELLAVINGWGYTPPLRTMAMLDRGDYGWVEFVAQSECNSADEIERFYRRHGAYLALLYALNSTDFHLENIIAAGEHPMLIDLETLFNSLADTFDVTLADVAAQKAMSESVMQVGMLPVRIWSGEEYDGIDISGLGGTPGQLSPDRIPEPTDAGTDAMHFVRRRFELPGDANRPTLDGQETSAVDHVESIVGGFVDMYRLLAQHKRDLLADDGPLQRFAEDEIRILLRPTRTYAQLLFESFHPDLLRDAVDRDLFLDRLWIVVPARPNLADVVIAERDDILMGDIPLFTSRPSTRDLYSASGTAISGVLSDAGMAIVRRRLHQLSEHDMRRQAWMIRASLGTLAPGLDRVPGTTHRLEGGPKGSPERDTNNSIGERLLLGARGVAEHLAASAIYGEEDAAWIGLEPMGEQYWSITPLGNDLYNGNPGIALFLAYAGKILDEERYTALARRAWRTMWQQAELLRSGLPEIGAFEGWGGVLYTLTHLGVLWDDQAVKDQAAGVIETLAGLVARNDTSDIVRGSAGAIASLLAYHHCMRSDSALAAAAACGDQLVESAQPMEFGAGWPIRRLGTKPLTGFAHGAAGIAWALLELAAATGKEKYREVAQQAIAYERSLYSPELGNWPDLRESDVDEGVDADSVRHVTAWCHGAGGIGLARLCALRHMDEPALRGEIRAALDTTLKAGLGHSHSLCHGDMGALDLMLEASQVLGERRWRDEAYRLGGLVLDSIERGGWQCGGPKGVEMPGLMLGLAGIGYGMLRLLDPERTPSILRLAPPVMGNGDLGIGARPDAIQNRTPSSEAPLEVE